jgi:hypothetical protein
MKHARGVAKLILNMLLKTLTEKDQLGDNIQTDLNPLHKNMMLTPGYSDGQIVTS